MLPSRFDSRRVRRSSGVRAFLAALALAAGIVAEPAWAQLADLVVNQADAPDPGPAGGVFTYTIRVDNNGPGSAPAVGLIDSLPSGSTFVGLSTTQGTCVEAAGTVSCALGDLPFLANATVTIQVRLPVAGVHTNTATATSDVIDPNTSNNIAIAEDTTAQNAADMTLAVTDTPDPVAAGQSYAYSLVARNNGPNALGASGTQTISFNVPGGACVTARPAGTGWTCLPATGYPMCSGAIACSRVGPLAVGASLPAVSVAATANVGGSITAAFNVDSSLPDGDPTNDTVTATTTVSGESSDVSITKTASAGSVPVGSNVTYTLTPRLNGGEPAGTLPPGTITVTDTLGAGLAFVSASGSGWTCSFAAPTVTCTRPGPFATNYTNMPTISIVATVTTTGTRTNTASISAPESDPVPANNTASVNVTGSNEANLRMTKAASLPVVSPGQNFNFTLTVRNLGPVAVAAGQTISVTDTLPAGLELRAAPSGTGWSCTPTMGFPLVAPVLVTCTRAGPLAVNTNAPAITVPVRASAAGTTTNTACVALSGPGPSDLSAGNNCDSENAAATGTTADLRLVSKTASPHPVFAGQNLTYVITVANDGPDVSTNVTVNDTLNSLLVTGGFQSATPSQGTCTPSGVTNGTAQNLACNLGTMNAGATATISVVIRPVRATTGSRNNTASVTSPDVGDPNPGNNTATVTSTVTAVADVAVTKVPTPSPVQAGTPLTYVVSASNAGPSTAANVGVVDTLPANAAFVQLSAVTGGGTCTTPAAGALGGTVQCTWASIASGAQQTATFVVRPLTGVAGSNLDNGATIATTTTELNLANNSASTSTPVTPALVDILVNKVDSIDPVALGESTVYTITVTNGGPSFATGVILTDTFPTGSPTATFSYQGSLGIAPAGAGTCIEPALGATSGALTCTFPGLASGASAVVTYAMRAEAIAAGLSGTTFNNASVAANEPESLPANNVTTHATTSRRTADLAIVKSAPASVTPGTTFSYGIAVTNNGPNDSNGAIVSDTLPTGLVFQSASPGCGFAGGVVTCTLGTLASGASANLSIDVRATSPFSGSSPLTNTASIAAVNEVDPVSSNNTHVASSTVSAPQVDLAIVKAGPANVGAGGALSWKLALSNAGPSAADGASFADVLPAGVTGVSASCGSATGGAACGTVNVGAGNVSGVVPTWPAGGTLVVTINATAPSGGALVNDATVTPASGSVDPNPSNNQSQTTTAVQPADLAIAKSHAGTFAQGQVGATYSITVSNVGAGTSSGLVSVVDTLPSGLAATAIGGTGWTCTLATLTCTRSDALAGGASFPAITLTVDVASSAPAALVNVAAVSGGGDPNAANNQASDPTTIGQLPDLAIAKSHSGTFTQGQIGASYAIVVSNVGSGPTSGAVTVGDALPSGLTATAIAGTGWSCTLATLACTRSDALASGASYPVITLTIDVAANAPLNLVNVASVSGGGDPNPANNQASDPTTIGQLPDLVITKTHSGQFTRGQVGAVYTLVVSNAGTGPSTGSVAVTDSLPGGLAATAMSGSDWSCTLATLTCTRADALAASASYPAITLTVNVSPSAPATLVNVVAVAGGGDANGGNNEASDSVALLAAAPVEIPTLSTVSLVALMLALGLLGARYRGAPARR
jgi:uncharacterized repeat protein (TIGR01451 family)